MLGVLRISVDSEIVVLVGLLLILLSCTFGVKAWVTVSARREKMKTKNAAVILILSSVDTKIMKRW